MQKFLSLFCCTCYCVGLGSFAYPRNSTIRTPRYDELYRYKLLHPTIENNYTCTDNEWLNMIKNLEYLFAADVHVFGPLLDKFRKIVTDIFDIKIGESDTSQHEFMHRSKLKTVDENRIANFVKDYTNTLKDTKSDLKMCWEVYMDYHENSIDAIQRCGEFVENAHFRYMSQQDIFSLTNINNLSLFTFHLRCSKYLIDIVDPNGMYALVEFNQIIFFKKGDIGFVIYREIERHPNIAVNDRRKQMRYAENEFAITFFLLLDMCFKIK